MAHYGVLRIRFDPKKKIRGKWNCVSVTLQWGVIVII